MREAVIVSGARTAIGSFQGALSTVPVGRLGAAAIREAVARSGVPGDQVDGVIMGCVLTGAVGQAPARQATIWGGLPHSVPATTVGKVCGSGLRSVMLAAAEIRCGDAEVMVAGGMESMTNAPYALPAARGGLRMGNGEIVDTMVNDGLFDVYNRYHMGMAAELCAAEMGITREMQDAFAAESYRKAQDAVTRGLFRREIAGVEVPQKKGDPVIFDTDEEPFKSKIDRIPTLKPAFKKDGTVTAANASSINDGAAAVVVTSEARARELGAKAAFRIVGGASHAQAPEWFTTAPAYAIQKAWKKTGLTDRDIDVYEINEAFSVVSLAVNRLCELDQSRINLRGGAVALGHPIGASGTRVLVTLMHVMEDTGARRGLTSLCIGGGEAVALIIERI
ncbi:MAG: acetyl-CoA C-acyltransferase [Deltaproteobacteria bacterium]|nr:acetyl-CoA C-acyltransferase [Deltaproteobacteria bacterium]